jgi:hypothetical protein
MVERSNPDSIKHHKKCDLIITGPEVWWKGTNTWLFVCFCSKSDEHSLVIKVSLDKLIINHSIINQIPKYSIKGRDPDIIEIISIRYMSSLL